jgi:hypothetical protein
MESITLHLHAQAFTLLLYALTKWHLLGFYFLQVECEQEAAPEDSRERIPPDPAEAFASFSQVGYVVQPHTFLFDACDARVPQELGEIQQPRKLGVVGEPETFSSYPSQALPSLPTRRPAQPPVLFSSALVD